ncbi:two-component system nitrogen regulation sensor histidine kinase NtrY [Altererythrobacter atlanticus]|uniref:histidine kinase n=1 Tax=Croceibacterium atlanticum TaxID=1267766 RepID=A0A0F7KQZ8_9SPHN|nr:ATP-binding protein [Croceibacterium atlanticum]AKH41612.1 Sensor histidine kinase YycG [Croceibacterium atlanticum]MBB5733074.1 two-component system nitrogen regulation sensor histidine kinase NtrY [Croceibacterium atlanticum]
MDSHAEPNRLRRLPRWWRRSMVIARRANLYFWLEVSSAIALLVMLAASWLTLASFSDPGEPVPSTQAAAMLVGTLIPALALIVLFGRRMAIRRAGGTTARLHVNLVFFFSLVAAIPTLLVAVFASILFQSGVEFWFSDQQRGILEDANELARGYYDENQRSMSAQAMAMAGDLRFVLQGSDLTSQEFQEQYGLQVYSRDLNESAILQEGENGALNVVAIVDPSEDFSRQRVSPEVLQQVRNSEEAVVTATRDQIEVVTVLDQPSGLYLYVMRDANPLAFSQWELAENVTRGYDLLTQRVRVLQVRFNLALFFVSLALVGLAVWFALRFADRQVKPLTELVSAAREVGSGNYALRIEGRTGPDEIGLLNRAFNRMTAQIERQTDALIGANRQLADRRAFIEAVLQSITAGIISVDREGQVLLMNSSAQNLLLDTAGPTPVGLELSVVAPQIDALLKSETGSGIVQYNRSGELLTLAVKVAPSAEGHVITFEDITRQLIDQRQAAWSDVARRIAHEIKNPLTPIQLAAERLKRRYRKQIHEDGQLFEELTGTIIRQVGGLRKMVDEFSSFARLPKPVFRHEDAVDLVRQALFLQEVAHQEVDYRFEAEPDLPHIDCDRHQFGQAMTNVLKNAAEAVDARARGEDQAFRGRINVSVFADNSYFCVRVVDNGVGLPQSAERIMEPYVTTREKGTGLGLAIVKKIVEEHGGELTFTPADGGGTCVTLRFARDPAAAATNSEAAE